MRTPALLPLSALASPPRLVVDVDPQARVTRRLLLLVDRSGSMQGPAWQRAQAAAQQLAQQPVDELELSLMAFGSEPLRWPEGWVPLPDRDAVGRATRWLAQRGASGDTRLVPALRAALAEDVGELTVVVVSDGLFQRESEAEILATLAAAQAEREEPALVCAYTVGQRRAVMDALGRAGRGGAYREVEGGPPVQGMRGW